MYERLIDEGSIGFLFPEKPSPQADSQWEAAARFVDSVSAMRVSRFDGMSKAEIKFERLRARNLA